MAETQPKMNSVYQIKIVLTGSKPPIWRRFIVPYDISLGRLHDVIQIVMGWEDYHLHSFRIAGREYEEPDPECEPDTLNEDMFKLFEVITAEKQRFGYDYDFGDRWSHDLFVEKIMPAEPEQQCPAVIAGKRACPPEDSGGVWGYMDMLQIVANPKSEWDKERVEWLGNDFDPDAFDIKRINRTLKVVRKFRKP